MSERSRTVTALACACAALASCTLDTAPANRAGRPQSDAPVGDGGRPDTSLPPPRDAGDPRDTGAEAGRDATAAMDAGADTAAPALDAAQDTGPDAMADAGPLPRPPTLLSTHLAGGGTTSSPSYRLRHAVGTQRPTLARSPTAASASTHYRLSHGLAGFTP